MAVLSHNVLSLVGLLCCLLRQTNGNLSSKLYLLEKTENSFDENYINDDFNQVMWSSDNSNHNTVFWSKVSDFFNFKVLELFVSNNNLRNLNETKFQNFSSMPTKKLFSIHENKKLNMNTSKRIPRSLNDTQNSTVIQPSVTSSTIYQEPFTSTEKNTSFSNRSIDSMSISSTVLANNSTTSQVVYNSTTSPVVNNSTPMNVTDQPLSSSPVITNNHTLQDNSTNNEKIDILSNSLPYEPNYYGISLLVLGATIILVIGIFFAYKKYQDTGRQAIYHIGGMCSSKVHEETPI